MVDDDAAIAEMVGIVLSSRGFEVVSAADGPSALETFDRARPDLVLLDLMLPGLDGLEVCRRLRTRSGVHIIMLTARSETSDVVAGLDAGADDYLTKPFEPEELVARVRARVRRTAEDPAAAVRRIADLTIDMNAHEVTRDGAVVQLTPLEFDLLAHLAASPRTAFSREDLLRDVWGYRHRADTRLVNVHVQRLRSKIEKDPDNPAIIVTVRGVGYRAGEPE